MNTAAIQSDATASSQKPPVVDPIDPENNNPEGSEIKKKSDPIESRFDKLEAMADSFNEHRQTDLDEAVENDPGLAYNQHSIERDLDAANAAINNPPSEDSSEPELQAVTAPVEDPPVVPTVIPIDKNADPEDPLKDFIVMRDGVAMFITKVDGEEKLVPLERARAQLQKHEAAEIRLQNVNTLSRDLDQREHVISVNETALQAKIDQFSSPPPEPSDVDDQALEDEAKSLVSTLFTGSEEDAAKAMKDMLINARKPVQQAEAINTEDIVAQAVTATRTQIAQDSINKDAADGFTQFKADYPDVMADTNLYRVADAMTDEIAEENPGWLPSQCMAEAGKRTREWVKSSKIPPAGLAEEPADTSDRQARKSKLVPQPRPAHAVQPAVKEEPVQTPAGVIQEMRDARNQP